MNTAATFPLNAWYAASWDAELKQELLARTICGKKIAFYRTPAGQPVALEDACWHRLLPLSMGRLNGDNVVCGYHGLRLQSAWPLYPDAVAGNNKSVGLRPQFSGD